MMSGEGRPSSASFDVEARALDLRWRGKHMRIRHDDSLLTRRSAVVQRLDAAMTITTEVATLRFVVAPERAFDVQVLDDGRRGPAQAADAVASAS